MPSEELHKKIQQFDSIFRTFHGKDLNTEVRDPVKTLTNLMIKKFPTTPREIISLFCKTRLFIRLKFLNDQIKEKEKALKKRFAMHVNKF